MTNKFQHSIKVGDGILVIGGESWPEFSMNYIEAYGQNAFDTLVDVFGRAVGALDVMERAVQNVQNGGLTGVNPGLNPQTSPPQWQPQSRAQDPAPAVMCAHGAMIPRNGKGAKGPWSGHFCPTPKGSPDQCPPVWG